MTDSETSYNAGFRDGINFVVTQLLSAADLVERNLYTEAENKETGKSHSVIQRAGMTTFARRLRELAAELSRHINH